MRDISNVLCSAKPPPPAKQIPAALDEINQLVLRLDKYNHELFQAVDPVLRHDEPESPDKACCQAPSPSIPLVGRLQDVISHLEQMCQEVGAITGRVEL